MAVTSEDHSNAWIVKVGGDLVGREIADLRAAVEVRGRRPGMMHVVIDLAPVRFIDSEGLETLLAVQKRCEERGGSLSLAHLTPDVNKILQITRLERRFEYSNQMPSALKAAA